MKKKQRIICISVVIGLIVTWIVGVAVYVNLPPKESEWNVHISVEHVSKSGLTLHMERNDVDGEAVELTTGDNFGVEKWTFFGWKPVWMKEGIGFNAVGYPMDETYEKTWEIDFEICYDGLPMGLYRISKDAFISKNYNINEIYYAPFVVVNLWGTLLSVLVVALLIFVIWKFGTALNFQKIKEKIANRKEIKLKKSIVIAVGVTLISVGVIWSVVDYFIAEFTNAIHRIEVAATEANSKFVKGTFTCDEETYRLFRSEKFTVEKKGILGWHTIAPEVKVELSDKPVKYMSIEPEPTKYIRINWTPYYGDLSAGTYRIKQAFKAFKMENTGENEVLKEGYYYITFEVE